jgi:thiamine kinase-like enzyme
VGKFASPVPGNRAVAMAYRMYEREVAFYRQIASTIDVSAPHCFAAEIDPTTGDFVLLLEDLSALTTGDQVAGCSAATAKKIIDAIVPLHAKFWGHPEDLGVDAVPRIDGDAQMVGITAACEVGWDPCMAKFGHVVADEITQSRDRFLAAVPEMHRMIGRRVQTIIHGDVRLDNLMFGDDKVVLLDWTLSISTGLQDVAYLLSQNVTTDERRAHETELLEHYRQRLAEHGIDHPLEQIWDDYRTAVLYMFCYAVVIAGTLDPANERGSAFMEKLVERASATFIDHDILAMLPG